MKKWTRALYQPNLPLTSAGFVTASKENVALSRRAAREGAVLLKNDNHLLPLAADTPIAVFGKGSADYVKGGGGSGDVTVAYMHTILDGLRGQKARIFEPLCWFYQEYVRAEYQKGSVPGMMAEPSLPQELFAAAREYADTAVIVLSRFSGESWDRSDLEFEDPDGADWENANAIARARQVGELFGKSDWYLSAQEKDLVEQVCVAFPKVAVVLNVGGCMDVSLFHDDARVSSLLYAYQGGMEGGDAVAELLLGKDSPCGKLPDTLARTLEAYPSTRDFHKSVEYVAYTEDVYMGYRYFETIPDAAKDVVYPFGYGLSYTTFSKESVSIQEENDVLTISIRVTNTGTCSGREVVELYFEAPQGLLQKPHRVLAAFKKTSRLAPAQSEIVTFTLPITQMASFDDVGRIALSAWVLEKGAYRLYVGGSVSEAKALEYVYHLEETRVVETVSDSLTPSRLEHRLQADGSYEPVPAGRDHNPNETILPKELKKEPVFPHGSYESAANVHTLLDVAENKLTLDDFMAQLSNDALIHLVCGQPNTSVSNTGGMGNLPAYGIPTITTADGPAGLRLAPETGLTTTAFPCETLLAATWDVDLINEVGAAVAGEVKENNISVWLAPGVNLHRNPMCGRNFEYMSEDPLLTGKMAAAMVRGIQSQNVAATVKHFACNGKETNRKNSDSRLSKRALRELYLKSFEIIVKEGEPWAIMSSYNIINGQRASESRELLTDILRSDWGYDGLVMSDWSNYGEHYKEVLAGNDLKMDKGFPDRIKAAMELGAVTRADLLVCVRRVLELILRIS